MAKRRRASRKLAALLELAAGRASRPWFATHGKTLIKSLAAVRTSLNPLLAYGVTVSRLLRSSKPVTVTEVQPSRPGRRRTSRQSRRRLEVPAEQDVEESTSTEAVPSVVSIEESDAPAPILTSQSQIYEETLSNMENILQRVTRVTSFTRWDGQQVSWPESLKMQDEAESTKEGLPVSEVASTQNQRLLAANMNLLSKTHLAVVSGMEATMARAIRATSLGRLPVTSSRLRSPSLLTSYPLTLRRTIRGSLSARPPSATRVQKGSSYPTQTSAPTVSWDLPAGALSPSLARALWVGRHFRTLATSAISPAATGVQGPPVGVTPPTGTRSISTAIETPSHLKRLPESEWSGISTAPKPPSSANVETSSVLEGLTERRPRVIEPAAMAELSGAANSKNAALNTVGSRTLTLALALPSPLTYGLMKQDQTFVATTALSWRIGSMLTESIRRAVLVQPRPPLDRSPAQIIGSGVATSLGTARESRLEPSVPSEVEARYPRRKMYPSSSVENEKSELKMPLSRWMQRGAMPGLDDSSHPSAGAGAFFSDLQTTLGDVAAIGGGGFLIDANSFRSAPSPLSLVSAARSMLESTVSSMSESRMMAIAALGLPTPTNNEGISPSLTQPASAKAGSMGSSGATAQRSSFLEITPDIMSTSSSETGDRTAPYASSRTPSTGELGPIAVPAESAGSINKLSTTLAGAMPVLIEVSSVRAGVKTEVQSPIMPTTYSHARPAPTSPTSVSSRGVILPRLNRTDEREWPAALSLASPNLEEANSALPSAPGAQPLSEEEGLVELRRKFEKIIAEELRRHGHQV